MIDENFLKTMIKERNTIAMKQVTDNELKQVVDYILKYSPNIVSLSFTEGSITKEGIGYIAEKIGHKLHFLDLSNNNLVDTDIEPLKQTTSLKELLLDDNFLSKKGVESLNLTLRLDFLSADPHPSFKQFIVHENIVLS
eukprot:c35265_g1_i1.p1 GENE.c35265_g1_i1~~c35265_g1_i1.p1  ORF type:complete len:139 (-),score=13.57 c35265_g1_i1:74-490(-)